MPQESHSDRDHQRMGMGAEDYCTCGRTWPHAPVENGQAIREGDRVYIGGGKTQWQVHTIDARGNVLVQSRVSKRWREAKLADLTRVPLS